MLNFLLVMVVYYHVEVVICVFERSKCVLECSSREREREYVFVSSAFCRKPN